MKTILVSGASGIVGYGILKNLKGNNFNLIGTSIYNNSVAKKYCNLFIQAVPTKDKNYLSWLNQTIERYSIDLIIPGIEVDLYFWNANRNKINTKVILNNSELICLCQDKWNFYQKLESGTIIDYLNIPSMISTDYNKIVKELGSPFLLKPKQGYGSKDIVKIESKSDFLKQMSRSDKQFFSQKYIGSDDEEYTVSFFGDGNGKSLVNIILKRKLSSSGYTEQATSTINKNDIIDINNIINDIAEYFNPIGPTNIQLRKEGCYFKLLEINPRLSASTAIRTGFNYNECLMAVDFYLNGVLPIQPKIQSGSCVRYIDEHFTY